MRLLQIFLICTCTLFLDRRVTIKAWGFEEGTGSQPYRGGGQP